jgi:hypothetical protein
VHDYAAVNNQDAWANLFDVLEIVRCKDDRHPAFSVDGSQELSDTILGGNIKPDGWLIKEQDLWVVQQGERHLRSHPLTQRQLPHRELNELTHVK